MCVFVSVASVCICLFRYVYQFCHPVYFIDVFFSLLHFSVIPSSFVCGGAYLLFGRAINLLKRHKFYILWENTQFSKFTNCCSWGKCFIKVAESCFLTQNLYFLQSTSCNCFNKIMAKPLKLVSSVFIFCQKKAFQKLSKMLYISSEKFILFLRYSTFCNVSPPFHSFQNQRKDQVKLEELSCPKLICIN